MTLEELKAQHPEIFAAAQAEGVTKERSRVSALLKMGESHKCADVAAKAITEGKSLSDDECLADFLSAGKLADDKDKIEKDENDTADAVDGKKTPEEDDDAFGKAVADLVCGSQDTEA